MNPSIDWSGHSFTSKCKCRNPYSNATKTVVDCICTRYLVCRSEFFFLKAFSKRVINSSLVRCDMCFNSNALSILLPGFNLFLRASIALDMVCFWSSCSKPHSCKALPRKWPASCSNWSCSVHAFHVAAISNVGNHSSSLIPWLSPWKGSTGGAFPFWPLDLIAVIERDPSLAGLSSGQLALGQYKHHIYPLYVAMHFVCV